MNDLKPFFQATELYKYYTDGDVRAVDGVSLTLEKGKIVALMGSSGCGKSTLLNLIGQLDNVDRGELSYQGINIKDLIINSQFRRDNFGFIFQFHHLIPVLTLRENIEAALIHNGMSQIQRRLKSESLLEDMGLKHRINARTSNVSGGERQRAAIARALSNHPSIILADEPTGNVDSNTSNMILTHLRDYVKEQQSAMLIATHDPLVSDIADVILHMKDGKIVSIDNIIEGDEHE